MKKWIRWWGFIAFILLILLTLGIWYLLADRIIENNIEEVGEFVIGAKVDIGKVDFTIIPLGLTLNKLQIADPNSPMQNLIDVDNIRLHLDGKYLFERKVIIKDMVVEGLKFNTERDKSGEIVGAKPLTVKHAYKEFILPLMDLSKLKEFVEKEELQSLEGLNSILTDIKRVNEEWKATYRMMPNVDDMIEYRNRAKIIISDVKANKVSGLLTNARGIKRIKEQINRDIDNIKLNTKAMIIDIDSLETKKNRALNFIEQDIAKLRDKYTPDIHGFKNFSKYIFTDDVLRQIDEGLLWYNKLEPLFNYIYNNLKDDYYGSESYLYDGIDVQFTEHDPKPSFFIELAKLSFEQSFGNLSGEINNFSTQQNISGLPTTIILNGTNLDFAESVNFTGIINHVNTDDIEDNISLSIQKQKIKRTSYKIIDDWGLHIENGLVDRNFTLNIINGKIESNLKLNFVGTSLNSNYLGGTNILINNIDSVLTQVSDFYVDINISGTADNYRTTINSNLDNIVDNAVRNIVKTEANKVNNTLNKTINDKKEELIKNIESDMKQLMLELAKVDDILIEAKKILKELP